MVDRYYRNLVIPKFDQRLCNSLTTLALSIIDRGLCNDYEYTHVDHLRFYDPRNDIPELVDIKNDCNIRAGINLFFLPPNSTMPVHRDQNVGGKRGCSIALPVLPHTDISPTNWYEHTDSIMPSAYAHWEQHKPKLINMLELHNVSSGKAWRCNLQISLDREYDTVVDMIQSQSLFKTISVVLDNG